LSAPRAGVRATWLQAAVLACHALLTGAAALLAYSLAASSPARELGALLATAPLVAVLPRLAKGRRGVLPWTALLLVVYSGAASVEVIASAGASWAASAALLAALVELGCLLVLTRRN
jgi:hypothetical protein